MRKLLKLLPFLFLIGCSEKQPENKSQVALEENFVSIYERDNVEDYSYYITALKNNQNKDTYEIIVYYRNYQVRSRYVCVVSEENGEYHFTYYLYNDEQPYVWVSEE